VHRIAHFCSGLQIVEQHSKLGNSHNMNFYLQKKKRWGQKQILVEQINVFVTSSYHASFPQKTLYHSYLNDIPNIFQNYYNFVLAYVTLFMKSALLNAAWHGE
jgi:hypothetical protein